MKSFNFTYIKSSLALFPAFVKEMLQVVIAPRQGWQDTERAALPVRTLIIQGYIPFITIVALSSFLPLIYRQSASVSVCLLDAISLFVRYFIGYFTASFMLGYALKHILDNDSLPSADKTDRLVLYTLATLAFLSLIGNVCPVELALLRMLPLYIVYVIWEASWHMIIPAERRFQFLGVTVLSCVIPLFLVHLFFALLNQ